MRKRRGTASLPEDRFADFLGAVIPQVPRPAQGLTPELMERWKRDKAGLREALRTALIPPPKPFYDDVTHDEVTIDYDLTIEEMIAQCDFATVDSDITHEHFGLPGSTRCQWRQVSRSVFSMRFGHADKMSSFSIMGEMFKVERWAARIEHILAWMRQEPYRCWSSSCMVALASIWQDGEGLLRVPGIGPSTCPGKPALYLSYFNDGCWMGTGYCFAAVGAYKEKE